MVLCCGVLCAETETGSLTSIIALPFTSLSIRSTIEKLSYALTIIMIWQVFMIISERAIDWAPDKLCFCLLFSEFPSRVINNTKVSEYCTSLNCVNLFTGSIYSRGVSSFTSIWRNIFEVHGQLFIIFIFTNV